jgi:phosphoglycerate dehydrogenase-like enzyme
MSRTLFAARSDKLRWIHTAAAGVRALLFDELVASPVILTNSAGVHAIPMAEYVLGGVLHLLRQFDVAIELQRQARWDKEPFVGPTSRMRELGDCRALIVGTGGIGGEVGRRFGALGARCVGVRRRPELGAPEGFERVIGLDEIDSALPNADIVVLAAPLTASTSRLLTAERLDRLSSGAIVVNVARGALLDSDALVERIRDGRLRGAVLDVFDEEPLPPSDPLWSLPQVLLTPHVSAVSPGRFWERQIDLVVENWRRFDRGERMRNVVDKREGY